MADFLEMEASVEVSGGAWERGGEEERGRGGMDEWRDGGGMGQEWLATSWTRSVTTASTGRSALRVWWAAS